MKRKLIHLVVLVLTIMSSVATAAPASAVTYGDPVEAPQIEFPEVVPVWVGGTSLCSGTLITQQVVLTAAHCVYGQAGPFQISVGGSTLKSGRLIDVDATWYHPRYDATYNQNDIGLLHLKTPANVSRLGNLPSKSLKSVGKKFLIVGWGTDQNGSITGRLHRLTLNDQTVASQKNFKGVYNPKTMIGAGRYFPDEILYGGGCTGDSGGPLYMGALGASRTVIGLTAFGARNCTTYKPTIFTRVDFYLAEINKGVQLLNSRAATAPINSGKATPPGLGPTTTTTTIPAKPLTSRCDQDSSYDWAGKNQGFSATCYSSLQFGYQGWNGFSPKDFIHLTKVCLSIDGRVPKGVAFEYTDVPYTAGPGCWEFTRSYYFNITSTNNGPGQHTATITMTDSLGRSSANTFQFSAP